MAQLSDIEIAQAAKMQPITEVAKTAGIADEYLEQYAREKFHMQRPNEYIYIIEE